MTYTGATEQEVLAIFAISLQWDSIGWQEVCVTETNQDGCIGLPVCEDVFVQDDVWSVEESGSSATLSAFPNPTSDMLTVSHPSLVLGGEMEVVDPKGQVVRSFEVQTNPAVLFVGDLPSGMYFLRLGNSDALPFQTID